MTQGRFIMQGHVCGAIQVSVRGPHRRFAGTAFAGSVLVLMITLNTAGALAETIAVSSGIQTTAAESQEVPRAAEVVNEVNVSDTDKEESGTIDLLTADLNEHWKVFSSAPTGPDTPVWKVVSQGDDKELILVCSGEPKGFLYTKQVCTEFELTLEWKYPVAEDGNSGVLVYTQDEPRIWPTSMQVQLHQPKAGSVFPSGDATSDQSSELENDLARPVDTWNEVRILSRKDGQLSVEVNGRKAGEVTGAKPCTGSIALQSEGSVVHFRRIRLKRFVADEALKRAEIPASVSTP